MLLIEFVKNMTSTGTPVPNAVTIPGKIVLKLSVVMFVALYHPAIGWRERLD